LEGKEGPNFILIYNYLIDKMSDTSKECPKCGAILETEVTFCPLCGTPQKKIKTSKDPTITAILSFIITGLGQVYLGHYVRGIILFMISASILLLLPMYSDNSQMNFMAILVIGFIATYDAYILAKKT
jgi:TM2 domain-containing membrane protein YozV